MLQKRSNEYVTVQETHKSYDALYYPLMFWMCEDGYHFEIYEINPVTGLSTKKRVSSMKFYAYRMMICRNFKVLNKCRNHEIQMIVCNMIRYPL